MPDRSLVDVDAGTAFQRPLMVVLALTFAAGILDAVGYGRFGVFTANQAGNLVVGWTLLPDEPAAAVLSFVSILGCGLGVTVIVVLRHRWTRLAGPAGSRTLLVVAAGLIVVAAAIGRALTDDPRGGPAVIPDLGTGPWWSDAASVWLSAFSVAALATVFISGGGTRASILASTNAYVDAVRFGVASGLDRTEARWGRQARRAAGFPLAWSLGAAVTVVLPLEMVAMTSIADVVIVAVAFFARRVTAETDG